MPLPTIHQTEAERLAKIAELDNLDPNAEGIDPAAPVIDQNKPAPVVTPTPKEGDALIPPVAPVVIDPPVIDPAAPVIDQNKQTPPIDYEKKFKDSAAEARILALRNETYEKKIEEAENLSDPTDDECRKEFGETWDEKDDMDKKVAKQILKDKKYKEIVRAIRKEQKQDKEYMDKVAAFAVTPDVLKQFPELEGNEAAFVEFASKPTRRNLDLEDVAVIFRGTRQAKGKAPSGSLFPTPTTSQTKQTPNPAKLSADKMETLRKVDHKAYQEQIKSGKVKPADLLD